ncbi:MAG: tRNA pseudouridine(38-40) synthase TruA [Myxococcota bacterium]|nr:tRNA pseudouridine(38-40) synthase TruA [Myxococcota bacterium]
MLGVRLVVAYDGTAFAGWQRQLAERTVQQVLEEAIERIAGAPTTVRGCSRTDAGVHAHGQVAAFDTERDITPHAWVRGLNSQLPADVSIRSAEPCAPGYQPRYDALGKTYRYLLHLAATRDPMLRTTAWHLGPRLARPLPGELGRPEHRTALEHWLDLDAMDEAARRMEGEHDFDAFRSMRDDRENSVRRLHHVRLTRGWMQPELVAIEVRGTAFMQHMVRIIAGTLVEVGRERLTPDDISALLAREKDRTHAGQTAPARGLHLLRIELGRAASGGRSSG